MHLTVRDVERFSWTWQDRPVEVIYEILGSGSPILVLPAFSTVSSREEMRPLASHLVSSGFACTIVDWPGFGSSTRGDLGYGPELYHRFLADFVAATMLGGTAVIAAGHASGYALALGHARPGLWRRMVLLAPTWRGPLPTAMGLRPRTYGLVRNLIATPFVGEAFYRLNTHPRIIGMMYRRHVYADAALVTPKFVATKRGFACRRGARFASAAFVTGALDPTPDRRSFQALLTPPPAPTLVVCGAATPRKSKAEMAAIVFDQDVRVEWVPGSLGLYEESAAIISGPITAFLAE